MRDAFVDLLVAERTVLGVDRLARGLRSCSGLRVRAALQRNPTTIVTAWSFLPIVPTDLICYVCGVMKISFARFMIGVLIGEGAICAIYIFAGSSLLEFGKRWLGA